ncbi:MAG: alpha/beta fold hydrolase [Candidatus Hydrogenedentota bacterium]
MRIQPLFFKKRAISSLVLAMWITAMSVSTFAEEKDVRGFPDLKRRSVTFWSDGTRLAGDLTYPANIKEGEKLPTLVMCHGWGGVKRHLNGMIGPQFAKEGYVVFTFDYRGWGESDSRLVVTGEMPKPDADGMVTVKALAIRQLVDPLDQQEDIDAAITFVEGESIVDTDHIGIWGSSFGGGHVIWRAAHDDRVKCVLAQVGAMNQRLGVVAQYGAGGKDGHKEIHAEKIRRVRGELAPVPLGQEKPEGLTGDPYYERFYEFVPVDFTDNITCPVLILDADQEHYFDNKEHGGRVYEQLKGRVPVEYHLLKNTGHYDVYAKSLKQVMSLELPFLEKHLKNR